MVATQQVTGFLENTCGDRNRNKAMKVFLSSAHEDLVEYRAKAAQAIERLGQGGVQ